MSKEAFVLHLAEGGFVCCGPRRTWSRVPHVWDATLFPSFLAAQAFRHHTNLDAEIVDANNVHIDADRIGTFLATNGVFS